MKTPLLLSGLIAVLLLVAACAGKQPAPAAALEPAASAEEATTAEETSTATESATTAETETKPVTASKSGSSGTHTVEITVSGFLPGTVTVKAGDKVEWTNLHTVDAWPASAVHPTHQAYPGSSINKCNTADENKIFDACDRLQQGESYSFVFTQRGTWKYHNHLNPGQTGTVVVE